MISLRLTKDSPYHLLDLAMDTAAKRVLAHRHCDHFMGQEWRGGDAKVTPNSNLGIRAPGATGRSPTRTRPPLRSSSEATNRNRCNRCNRCNRSS